MPLAAAAPPVPINVCVILPPVDLTVTAKHSRGALTRDPDTVRSYLESGRTTDAVKVSASESRLNFCR